MKPEKEYIIVGKEEFKRTTLDKIITMVWGLVALSSIWVGWGVFHYFDPSMPSLADMLTFMWRDTNDFPPPPPPPLTPTPQTIYWPESRGGELVAFFPFSGDAEDESGYGRHAQPIGTNLTQDRFGQYEGAYYLNGRAFINLGQPSASEAVTLSFWFEANSFRNSQLLFTNYPNCTTTTGLAVTHLTEYGNHYLQFSSYDGVQENRETFGMPTLDSGEWHHFVGVFSPDLTQFYVNGKFVGETEIGYTPAASSWLLGGTNGCSQQTAGFIGSLDSVRFYNYPFTPLDAQELYAREQ